MKKIIINEDLTAQYWNIIINEDLTAQYWNITGLHRSEEPKALNGGKLDAANAAQPVFCFAENNPYEQIKFLR